MSQAKRPRAAGSTTSNYFPEYVLRVDRNLMLYLPRLAVLVSIEADRPGTWFPGPLGPYQAWFPAIYFSRDFDLVKVPGNPMKSPFGFGVFLGVHVKHLLSGLNKLLKGNFRSLRLAPGDPRGACCIHFSIRKIAPPISVYVR